MTQQFARVPADAGAVVREVRGFGGVPWARLFQYLRPNLGRFGLFGVSGYRPTRRKTRSRIDTEAPR